MLRKEADVEEHPEAPLINFEKWTHLKEKALDATHYCHIRPQDECDEGSLEMAMAYLTRQLQPITIDDDFNRTLQTESNRLRQKEVQRRGVDVIHSVGFQPH